MFRKLLLISILPFIYLSGDACSCSILATTSYYYQNADFVGIVKILKNYKNIPDSNLYYQADVEIIDLYKGKKVKSIWIEGTNGGRYGSSCGTFIPEAEIRLIYANRGQDGLLKTYLCTSTNRPLEPYFKQNNTREKLVLLKKYASKYTHIIYNETLYYPAAFKFIVDKTKLNYFSLVMVTLSKDYEIKNLNILNTAPQELKEAYTQYFKQKINWKQKMKGIKTDPRKNDIQLIFEINPYVSKTS